MTLVRFGVADFAGEGRRKLNIGRSLTKESKRCEEYEPVLCNGL